MGEVRSVSKTGGVKGVKRARFDLVPARAMRLLAEHFGRGALKYADHNWRKGYEWGKSIAALERHLNAFKDNEDYDVCPEDGEGCSFVDSEGNPFKPEEPGTCFNHMGSLHMVAVLWHAVVLTEAFFDHPEFDDRWKGVPKKNEEEDVDKGRTIVNYGPALLGKSWYSSLAEEETVNAMRLRAQMQQALDGGSR